MDRTHREARDAEKWVANVFGGHLTSASGSGTKDKNDVLTDTEVFEVKYTERKSFSLKLTDLIALQTQGFLKNRKPVFHITYSDPILGKRRWVVLPEMDYRLLTGMDD